ncbi:MAG: hypothetical protein HN390_00130, partial [Anaerolineae bacterium]|nr:hypothetical protein [Anaerolineae bacterium]
PFTLPNCRLLRHNWRRYCWKDDISTLEAKVPKRYEEQSFLLSDLTASKLEHLGYSDTAISAFKTIYSELIKNAFEHGCKKDADKIKVVLDITNVYVSISVVNPFPRKVHLKKTLSERSNASNLGVRGRGLLLCRDLADSIKPISRGLGVKAVIYRERVEFDIKTHQDVMIISIRKGESNPALITKLETIALTYPDKRIIFHFHSNTGVRNTDVAGLVVRINLPSYSRLYLPPYSPQLSNFEDEQISESIQNNVRAVILFLGAIDSIFYLHDNMIARDWEEAFKKIGRSDLYRDFFPKQSNDDVFDEFREDDMFDEEEEKEDGDGGGDIFDEFRDDNDDDLGINQRW